jgi:hypothetical protein
MASILLARANTERQLRNMTEAEHVRPFTHVQERAHYRGCTLSGIECAVWRSNVPFAAGRGDVLSSTVTLLASSGISF